MNAAIISSFIQTCKQHKLNPHTYLNDVITTLTSAKDVDLDALLPGNWIPVMWLTGHIRTQAARAVDCLNGDPHTDDLEDLCHCCPDGEGLNLRSGRRSLAEVDNDRSPLWHLDQACLA